MTDRTSLEGMNVLAVEDEMLVAMMLEDILEDAGCNAIVAGHLEEALILAQERDLDAAILDENLHGTRSYPVADALIARAIPFIFATGYGEKNLRELYPGRSVIAKPYRDRDVIAALTALISADPSVRCDLR